MKTIIEIFAVLALLTCLSVEAISWPWPIEQSIYNASLAELDPYGRQIKVGLVKTLTMSRWNWSRVATSFTFCEETVSFCGVKFCSPVETCSRYKIASESEDQRCPGRYIAYEEVTRVFPESEFLPRELQVVEHFGRCGETEQPGRAKHTWEVHLIAGSGERLFTGDPIPLLSIQNAFPR